MPSRVVRGEIVASESLSRVSIGADLTFRSLIVAVDDYGRIDGRLPILKAALFPLRDDATMKKIDGWIDELCAGQNPPVMRYIVDGRPYIALCGWEKHRGKGRRGTTSKCPEPLPRKSEEIHSNPPGYREAGDGGREAGDGKRESARASSERTAPRSKAPPASLIDPRVEELWPAIRAAFLEHGCNLGDRVGHDRAELIAKRMAEGATPDDLVAAVHGYVQIHDGLKPDPKSGFEPRRWFQPKTVFKHEAFSDRVDAGRSRNVKHIDQERMARLKERWRV